MSIYFIEQAAKWTDIDDGSDCIGVPSLTFSVIANTF